MQSTSQNKITHNQRKLYFAVVTDIMKSKRDLIISLNGILTPLPIYTLPLEKARTLLKAVDLDFEQIDGKDASMAAGQISTTGMANHIRFLEQSALESGIKLHHYEKELERLSNFSNKDTVFVN